MTEQDLALIGIDAVSVGQDWLWGFTSITTLWIAGYVIGVVLTAIRKL